jgi:hypothetical protein
MLAKRFEGYSGGSLSCKRLALFDPPFIPVDRCVELTNAQIMHHQAYVETGRRSWLRQLARALLLSGG